MKTSLITSLLTLTTVLTATAQHPGGRGDRRPPGPPLVAILDTDHDKHLSAEEINAAAAALAKLDKNEDGELTPDELHLPPPPRERGKKDKGDDSRPKPPAPPIIAALDTDGDGTISASELAAAPASLKTLDKDGDGELSPEELGPPGPPPRGEGPRHGGRPQGPPPGEGEGAE